MANGNAGRQHRAKELEKLEKRAHKEERRAKAKAAARNLTPKPDAQ